MRSGNINIVDEQPDDGNLIPDQGMHQLDSPNVYPGGEQQGKDNPDIIVGIPIRREGAVDLSKYNFTVEIPDIDGFHNTSQFLYFSYWADKGTIDDKTIIYSIFIIPLIKQEVSDIWPENVEEITKPLTGTPQQFVGGNKTIIGYRVDLKADLKGPTIKGYASRLLYRQDFYVDIYESRNFAIMKESFLREYGDAINSTLVRVREIANEDYKSTQMALLQASDTKVIEKRRDELFLNNGDPEEQVFIQEILDDRANESSNKTTIDEEGNVKLGSLFKTAGHTSSIIAIYPPQDVANTIAASFPQFDIDPDDLHITVLFLGKAVGDEELGRMVGCIKRAAQNSPQLEFKITGLGVFNPSEHSDDKFPIYLAIDSIGLSELYSSMLAEFLDEGIEIDRHYGLTPHMTLTYADSKNGIEDIKVPDNISWLADDIKVLQGEDEFASIEFGSANSMEAKVAQVSMQDIIAPGGKSVMSLRPDEAHHDDNREEDSDIHLGNVDSAYEDAGGPMSSHEDDDKKYNIVRGASILFDGILKEAADYSKLNVWVYIPPITEWRNWDNGKNAYIYIYPGDMRISYLIQTSHGYHKDRALRIFAIRINRVGPKSASAGIMFDKEISEIPWIPDMSTKENIEYSDAMEVVSGVIQDMRKAISDDYKNYLINAPDKEFINKRREKLIKDSTMLTQDDEEHILLDNLDENFPSDIEFDEEGNVKKRIAIDYSKFTKSKLQPIAKRSTLVVPARPQKKDYTCGAAALRSAFAAFGVTYNEEELEKALKTSKTNGVDGDTMAEVADRLGLDIDVIENMSISDIKKYTHKKWPVMITYQSGNDDKDWENEWDEGHFAIITKVDGTILEFTDPANKSGFSKMEIEDFESRWHEEDSGKKHMQWGMVIKGIKDNSSGITDDNLSKIRIKQIGIIDGTKIFDVDGKIVRENVDIDFTNGGNNYQYLYVPKGEIWVEGEDEHDEAAIVLHEYVESMHMADGDAYVDAHDKASAAEMAFREEGNCTIKKIKKFIDKYNKENPDKN